MKNIEIDWKECRTNVILLLIFGVVGFLLSGGHLFGAVIIIFILAPFYRWRKEKVTEEQEVGSKPLSEKGKESLHDHLVEIGQISDKS